VKTSFGRTLTMLSVSAFFVGLVTMQPWLLWLGFVFAVSAIIASNTVVGQKEA